MCKELKELFEAATEANMEKYCQLVDRFPDLKSEKVLTYLREANYFTAPSSIRFHGDWIGGNFDHSMKRAFTGRAKNRRTSSECFTTCANVTRESSL